MSIFSIETPPRGIFRCANIGNVREQIDRRGVMNDAAYNRREKQNREWYAWRNLDGLCERQSKAQSNLRQDATFM